MNEKQMFAVCVRPRARLTKGKLYPVLPHSTETEFVTVLCNDIGYSEEYFKDRFSFVDISGSIEDLL